MCAGRAPCTLPEEIMFLDILINDQSGQTVAKFVVNAKTFSTGSKGFYGNGKVQIGDKQYQVQAQLVEIGSKPKDGGK
jgi:hypothetical protein